MCIDNFYYFILLLKKKFLPRSTKTTNQIEEKGFTVFKTESKLEL